MPKKVFELAKELEMGAIDLVEKLKSIGLNVRNHMVMLSDEDVEKAMSALKPDSSTDTQTKKKAVVRKKKVVRKTLIKKTTPVEEEVKLEAAEEDLDTEDPKKPVLRKKKEEKELEVEKPKKVFVEDKPQGLQVVSMPEIVAKETAQVESEPEEVKEEKKIFKERQHSFTPVFVPKDQPASKSKESSGDNDSDGDDEAQQKGDKKRIGNLASLMSKKGAKKDLTQFRADEELKIASALVGTTMYSPAKRKKVFTGDTKSTLITTVKDSKRVVTLYGGASTSELAQKLSIKFKELADKALDINLLLKPDDQLGIGLADELAALFDYKVEDRAFDEEKIITADEQEKDVESLPLRSPIITVMGHVDHGKTTLLDYIRKAKVASGEAGGITQHIGAYTVPVKDRILTFLDTPGHAAFANMRQRGANITDIVILVVAADDGVMPQTRESVKFIQNAGVPMIVAVNKMDKEGANPDRVKQELMEFGITPEEWGGDTQFVPVSALKGDGIDDLLESVQIQAEIMELRADPKGKAEGIVIESKIEQGRGPVATVLVQKGTLKKGDSIVVGETYGRARSLMDHNGKMLDSAGPSTPVQILGLQDAASPGDTVNVVKNDREAKKIVENRVDQRKQLELAGKKKVSLEDFFSDVSEAEKKTLNLIIRADVLGSFEAIKQSLESLANNEVKVEVIGGGVGAITDSDVIQGEAAQGYIIGFNMRPVTSARRLAEQKGVDIKNYSIIYELINDVKLALEGLLDPEQIEVYVGRAQVRDTFNIPKVGVIAGSIVEDGRIEKGCHIRLLREGKIMFDGKLASLKRFKDDVKEVKNGYECGIALEGYNDVKEGDTFEAYRLEEKKRTLELSQELTL